MNDVGGNVVQELTVVTDYEQLEHILVYRSGTSVGAYSLRPLSQIVLEPQNSFHV